VRDKALDEVSAKLGMDRDGLEGLAHQDIIAGQTGASYGGLPLWLGNEELHASHRSNLLRKAPLWYGQFGWTEPDDLPYIWPVPTSHTSPTHSHSHTASDAPTQESEPPIMETDMITTDNDAPAPRVAPSSPSNMNREQTIDSLRAAGYDGPVSYSKSRLLEMLSIVKNGGTIESPKRGRKVTADSSADLGN